MRYTSRKGRAAAKTLLVEIFTRALYVMKRRVCRLADGRLVTVAVRGDVKAARLTHRDTNTVIGKQRTRYICIILGRGGSTLAVDRTEGQGQGHAGGDKFIK